MKHYLSKIPAAMPVLALLALAPSKANATVVGSPHDFSALPGSNGQVCVFCHAPHNAGATAQQVIPLWNHTTTTSTFTLYTSETLNAIPGQPDSNSKACLSCHDGTVAIDAFGGRTPAPGIYVSGTRLIGTDLTNDHPISFTYDAALATADGGLVTPAGPGMVSPGIPLFSGKLQCASCHQVHDNSTYQPFLRASRVGSAICLRCHTK